MFLLILKLFFKKTKSSSFTFQYVSINTRKYTGGKPGDQNFTFQYVSINTDPWQANVLSDWTLHSNMFLLIRAYVARYILKKHNFTFQYVSINTSAGTTELSVSPSLHSNMFLLIHWPKDVRYPVIDLYIPICFY